VAVAELVQPPIALPAVCDDGGARLDNGSVELVPASLKEAKVPAASIFQFVLGAREERGDAFAGVRDTEISSSTEPQEESALCGIGCRENKDIALRSDSVA
jgi:hypothetical protein